MANKFSGLIGKNFLYMGKEIHVKDVLWREDDLYHLVTDGKTIKLTSAEIHSDLQPIVAEQEKNDYLALHQGVNVQVKDIQDLSKTLLENIKKLGTDATFIPQAAAINEQAKTLIEIKRTQIEMVRLLKERR